MRHPRSACRICCRMLDPAAPRYHMHRRTSFRLLLLLRFHVTPYQPIRKRGQGVRFQHRRSLHQPRGTNEKATRQQGGLFFQGRIVPTEAFRFRQNFLPKSYEPKNGGVKRFLVNKCLCFQRPRKCVNRPEECTKMRQFAHPSKVSRLFLGTYPVRRDSGALRWDPLRRLEPSL
jgi:hypothetical protein